MLTSRVELVGEPGRMTVRTRISRVDEQFVFEVMGRNRLDGLRGRPSMSMRHSIRRPQLLEASWISAAEMRCTSGRKSDWCRWAVEKGLNRIVSADLRALGILGSGTGSLKVLGLWGLVLRLL